MIYSEILGNTSNSKGCLMKSCFPWPAHQGWGLAYHWRMLLGWPLVDSRSRCSKPGELLAYSLKGTAISMDSYFRLQTLCWNDWQMSSDAALDCIGSGCIVQPIFLFGHQLGDIAPSGMHRSRWIGAAQPLRRSIYLSFLTLIRTARSIIQSFCAKSFQRNMSRTSNTCIYMFAMGWCRMSWGQL